MDAPERIWAEPDGGSILIHNGDPNLAALIATGYLTEYIRADLMAELVEAIGYLVGDMVADDKEDFASVNIARAALAKIKEQTP